MQLRSCSVVAIVGASVPEDYVRMYMYICTRENGPEVVCRVRMGMIHLLFFFSGSKQARLTSLR